MMHPRPTGPTKLVIRNIGLLLSGAMEKPILDADTIVAENGKITAIGRAKDVNTEGATTIVDANGTTVAPGLIDSHVHPVAGDWTPRQNQIGWIDSFLHGGVTTMISAGEVHMPGRPRDVVGAEGDGDLRAARVLDAPSRRREGACRRARDRMRNGRGGFQGTRRSRRQTARRSRPRRRQGRPDRAQDGRMGAQIRHPEHDPHRRSVDPRLRPDRQGRGAGSRHRRRRPHQWRPHRAARRPDPLHLRGLQARPGAGSQRQRTLGAVHAAHRARDGRSRRVILGTDSPAGSGVQPLGILRMVSLLSSLGEVPAEIAFCFATGNTARMRALDCGIIEVGRSADFVIMDKAQHSPGKNILDSVQLGDLPGVGMTIIDGIVRTQRSRNTPPADKGAGDRRALARHGHSGVRREGATRNCSGPLLFRAFGRIDKSSGPPRILPTTNSSRKLHSA